MKSLTSYLTLKSRIIMSIAVMAGAALLASGKAKNPEISKVDPPCWWVGMANDTLQLLVSGPDIAKTTVNVNYPGVTLTDDVATDSPNYKLLYFKIASDAKEGKMPLTFTLGKKSTTIDYPLLERTQNPQSYKGFSAEDVLYLIMPDRFARAKADSPATYSGLRTPYKPDRTHPSLRHGGDLKGIETHLDYLDSLGVTAIWVCPVLENDMPYGSYHGYATTDYYRIDPRFGTLEDWQTLVKEAHKRGIKVVMDMIFNHTGSDHPWLADMPMADWYNHPKGDNLTNFRLSTLHDPYVSDYDLDHTVNGWFVSSMPDLNQRNPHVMRYLTQSSIWWIENSKINGIRMDTYPYADMHGMGTWAKDVMAEYPNFNIVGECWYGNEAGSAFWQSGNRINPTETYLPTVMDFKLSIDAHKMFDEQTDPWNGLNHLYDHLALDFLFPDPQNILTFLDNHDTDRYLLTMPENLGSWKQAMTFLLTSRGIPQIYYGTEILMNGTKKISDGDIRMDFPGGFPGDTINAFTPEGRTPLQNEAWNFLQKILQWRRSKEVNEVIAQGSLKHFMPQNGIYTYRRALKDGREVIVMLNGNDEPLTVTMERTLEIMPYGTRLHNIITDSDITITEEITFAPREIMILQNF